MKIETYKLYKEFEYWTSFSLGIFFVALVCLLITFFLLEIDGLA